MSNLPLEGIRVVSFDLVLALPHACQWLAVYGAEVIHVESKSHPDGMRMSAGRLGGAADKIAGLNRSGSGNSLNYSKKSCNINMAKEKGRELAHRLIATADVAAENYSTQVAERFGLTYEALRLVKPDIILLSNSAMGRTGPLSHTIGPGPSIQAYGGFPLLTGYEGGTPQVMGGTWPDYMVGVAASFMLQAAIHHRDITGEGQFIDLSMAEMVTGMMPQAILDYEMNGRLRERQGNKDPLMVPHNTYRCAGADQWVAIAIETEEEWAALCQAVGHPEWLTSERFADAHARHRNEADLDALIAEWTKQRSPEEVTTWLQAHGVAAGPSLDTLGLISNAQLRHRGFFVTPDHPEVGPREVLGMPGVFSTIEKRVEPAPLFDQHNDYVFKDILGLSGSEFEQLVEEEVIY